MGAPFPAPEAPAFCLLIYRTPKSLLTPDMRTATAGEHTNTFEHKRRDSKYANWTELLWGCFMTEGKAEAAVYLNSKKNK